LPQCLYRQKQHQSLLLLQVSELNLHFIGTVQSNLSIRNDMIAIALLCITLLVPDSAIVIQTLPPYYALLFNGGSLPCPIGVGIIGGLSLPCLLNLSKRCFCFHFFRLSNRRHLPDSHGYHLYSRLIKLCRREQLESFIVLSPDFGHIF